MENDVEEKPSVSFLLKSSKTSNSMIHPPGFESYVAPNYSFLDSLPRARVSSFSYD